MGQCEFLGSIFVTVTLKKYFDLVFNFYKSVRIYVYKRGSAIKMIGTIYS